jgi:transmembrane sensor
VVIDASVVTKGAAKKKSSSASHRGRALMLKLTIALHQLPFSLSQRYLRFKQRVSRGNRDEMAYAIALSQELTWLNIKQRAELAAFGWPDASDALPAIPVELANECQERPDNVILFPNYRPLGPLHPPIEPPPPRPERPARKTPRPTRLRPGHAALLPQKPVWNLNWELGAVAVTCLVLLLIGFTPKPATLASEYFTALGERRVIPLPDGSLITLNTQSRVRVHLCAHERYIELLQGEAIFLVAEDSARPFHVRARKTVIEVLGTRFSINMGDRGTQIAVTEGRVKVFDAPQPNALTVDSEGMPRTDTVVFGAAKKDDGLLLGGGEEARINQDTFAAFEADTRLLPIDELERHLAWAEGNLVFAGEPLEEVVAEFNRYSWRKLKIADPAIAHYSIGGIFNTTDIDSLLQVLGKTHHISGIALRNPGSRDVVIELRRIPTASGAPP